MDTRTPEGPLTALSADRERDLEDLAATLWLYTGWYHVTRNLTTPQRELWADVIDADHAAQDADEGLTGTELAYTPVDRWWRTPGRDAAPLRDEPARGAADR